MNNKNLKLGIILLALILLAWIYQGPFKDWKANWGKQKNILAKVSPEEINKIEITQKGKITTLEKESDKWKVAGTKGFYAPQFASQNFIKALEDASKSDMEIVSENKDKKNSFLTSQEDGILIKLFSGEAIFEFIIGDKTPDYQGTYISSKEDKRTYSVGSNLFTAFNKSDWRDFNIFASNKDDIKKIRFQYPNREFEIELAEGEEGKKWQGVSPYKFNIDQEKMEEILNTMSSLTAIKIPEQNFEASGLEKHKIIVQASGEGIDNVLMIGNEDKEGFYYVKKGDSDNIYLITKEQRDILNKQIRDLR